MALYKINPEIFKRSFAPLKHLESFIFEPCGYFDYTVVSHKAFTLTEYPAGSNQTPPTRAQARVYWFDDIALKAIIKEYGSLDKAVEVYKDRTYKPKDKKQRREQALAIAWQNIEDMRPVSIEIKRLPALTKGNSFKANELRGVVYTFDGENTMVAVQ